jgi:hypothetical protein
MIVTTYTRMIRDDHQAECSAALHRVTRYLAHRTAHAETSASLHAFELSGTGRRTLDPDVPGAIRSVGIATGKVTHAA